MKKIYIILPLWALCSVLQAQNDQLIDITTLDQLNAMRYDFDGNGRAYASFNQSAYENAFGGAYGTLGSSLPPCAATGTFNCQGYELMADLNFSGTRWENPQGGTYAGTRVEGGWEPIYEYRAIFDGNGHTISDLYIERTVDLVGLFTHLRANAEVRNLGIIGKSSIRATGAISNVLRCIGSLVGQNLGKITACYATGAVTGEENFWAGGLVGHNLGTISTSYATGAVTGGSDTGGLVGYNLGTISTSYATGAVTGGSDTGGLVGENYGTISTSYATGDVTGGADRSSVGGLVGLTSSASIITACYATGAVTGGGGLTGGLVGDSYGTISTSYATGNVTGGADRSRVGGLVGINRGQISACYATGDVTGGGITGGLVGNNNGSISSSYATGAVTGGGITGGLLGYSNGTISTSYATGNVTGNGNNTGGLVGYNNEAISNCYATGNVTGNGNNTGGLVGYNNEAISNCYATGAVTGGSDTGGLVGYSNEAISNCYATGNVTGNGNNTGGLVGYNNEAISNCYATGVVTGDNNTGGLVGRNDGTMSTSYATGNVTGKSFYTGGLVGESYGTISTSYATGVVTGDNNTGGLVGYNSEAISNCYATGNVTGKGFYTGGLVGSANSGSLISTCYTISHVNGTADVGGLVGVERNDNGDGIRASYFCRGAYTPTEFARLSDKEVAKTVLELQSPSSYSGIYATWGDGGDDWELGTDKHYPRLKVDFDGSELTPPTATEFGSQRFLFTTNNDSNDREIFVLFAAANAASGSIIGYVHDLLSTETSFMRLGMSSNFVVSPRGEISIGPSADLDAEDDQKNAFVLKVSARVSESTTNLSVRVVVKATLNAGDPQLINITTLDQLHAMRYDSDGDGRVDLPSNQSAYESAFGWEYGTLRSSLPPCAAAGTFNCQGYELMADLSFLGTKWENPEEDTYTGTRVEGGWEPIDEYRAIFDGNGHTISALYIERAADRVGLFAFLGAIAEVRNLGIIGKSSIIGPLAIEDKTAYVGSLVGENRGKIRACYALGSVYGDSAGGLVGKSEGNISLCYASVTVKGWKRSGGLVGTNAGSLSSCYFTGSAGDIDRRDIPKPSNVNIGGLVGEHLNTGSIKTCYVSGIVEKAEKAEIVENIGALIASNQGGSVKDSYFDQDIYPPYQFKRLSDQDKGKTSSDLQSPTSYSGIYASWNDEGDYWDFGTDTQYPVLKVDFNRDGTPSVDEFGDQSRSKVESLFTITSMSPLSGEVGTLITIEGEGFSSDRFANQLIFNGNEGTSTDDVVATSMVIEISPQKLLVQVPVGAPTGKITLKNGHRSASSEEVWTVLRSAIPLGVATGESLVGVYPNPATTFLRFTHLSASKVYLYKIYTLIGQQLRSGTIGAVDHIDLSGLLVGSYVIVLEDEAGDTLLREQLLIRR